jgi:hypothetical protein
MPDTRRYEFHGEAAALGGRIVRIGEGKDAKPVEDGFIDLPGSALTAVGGRSTAQLVGAQLTQPVASSVVRFTSATTSAEGVFDDLQGQFAVTKGERDVSTLKATTTVRAEVQGLEVGRKGDVQLKARRVRAGFTARSALYGGETPVHLDADTTFDSVTFVDRDGKAYTLVVDVETGVFGQHDTFSTLIAAASELTFIRTFGHALHLLGLAGTEPAPTAPSLTRTDGGAVQGTIVKPLEWKGPAFPNASIDPNRPYFVVIPGLGTIYFGEITIARQSRRVTMIRARLGSPAGGDVAACDMQDNGSWG